MMKTAIYRGMEGKEVKIPYDENAPCLICGEPVIGASMGGTNICGACDCGRCRYCGVDVFVLKEEIDGGESHKRVLEHMKWHHEHTPELVKRVNASHRHLMDKLEAEREEREKQKESSGEKK
jgi:hypothetical protein